MVEAPDPKILMPVSPSGAVEQMMLEELRRVRAMGDKLVDATHEIKTETALFRAAIDKVMEDRREDRLLLSEHGREIQALKSWRDQQVGAHKGLTGAREWAPAIIVVIVALFILLKSGAVHL